MSLPDHRLDEGIPVMAKHVGYTWQPRRLVSISASEKKFTTDLGLCLTGDLLDQPRIGNVFHENSGNMFRA